MSVQGVAAPRALAVGRVNRAGIVLVLLGLATALALTRGSTAGLDTSFRLTAVSADVQLDPIVVSVRACVLACAAAIVATGVYGIAVRRERPLPRLALSVAVAALVLAFLCWAGGGKTINLAGLATATVAGALPLLLGALAGVLCERSGVINIAIEGQFLLGAFAASVVASLAGLWLGLLAGSLAGGAVGALLAVLAIRYLADQVVVGVVLNLLVLGLTGFLFSRIVVPHQATLGSPPIFETWRIPGLADLPVVGPALFEQNVMLYLALAILVAVAVMLRRTRWGLRTLAVGERPEAAHSAGVDVRRVRYRNVVAGGLVAGLGGVYLTIGSVGAFGPGISAGKGFIALAALIFGRWNPFGALVAACVFGFADAVQGTLAVVGTPIPTQLLQTFPYVVTILAVAGLVGRVRPPAADGKPFVPA